MTDDEEYVAALLDVLTAPAPADDGIDRYDGFGREVIVSGVEVVDGPYGDELEVSFVLDVPAGEEWAAVPAEGSTRVPFDAEWRRLSELDDPAAYAPQVASRVMSAARRHVELHQDPGREARHDAWRERARALLPDRETQRGLLRQALAAEGEVTQVAPDRFELRLRDRPTVDGLDRAGRVAAGDHVRAQCGGVGGGARRPHRRRRAALRRRDARRP